MTDLELYNEWKELDDYFRAQEYLEWGTLDHDRWQEHSRRCNRIGFLRTEIFRRFKKRAEKEATR